MRRVVVTGAAGFIGSHLVTHLLRAGYEVRMVDNLSTGCEENIQAADITLTADDLRRLDEAAPLGVAEGTRYPEGGMQAVDL